MTATVERPEAEELDKEANMYADREAAEAEGSADQPEGVETGTREEVESIQESLVMDVCEAYGRPYKATETSRPCAPLLTVSESVR